MNDQILNGKQLISWAIKIIHSLEVTGRKLFSSPTTVSKWLQILASSLKSLGCTLSFGTCWGQGVLLWQPRLWARPFRLKVFPHFPPVSGPPLPHSCFLTGPISLPSLPLSFLQLQTGQITVQSVHSITEHKGPTVGPAVTHRCKRVNRRDWLWAAHTYSSLTVE